MYGIYTDPVSEIEYAGAWGVKDNGSGGKAGGVAIDGVNTVILCDGARAIHAQGLVQNDNGIRIGRHTPVDSDYVASIDDCYNRNNRYFSCKKRTLPSVSLGRKLSIPYNKG